VDQTNAVRSEDRFATSNSLLRPGDVVEVDAGLAGRVRARLVV
jgi:hypothetical protein